MAKRAPTMVTIEQAGSDLKKALEQLDMGEAVKLVNAEGTPVAVVISLKPAPGRSELAPSRDWTEEWRALAQEIGCAWQTDLSAADVIAKMRR